MASKHGFAGLWLLAVVGCSDPMVPPSSDAPSTPECSAASCDDGVYCNGAERCAPADPDADARGCAPAIAPPCEPASCNEAARRCDLTCDEPDVDGDGAPSIACGGDDCDDDDPHRFPGNPEVCDDEGGVDEDCDGATFGARDADDDGYVDARCCNAGDEGPTCGDDCDDARMDVHPGLGELCDFVDNDCDGAIDEGSRVECYTDTDSDRYAPADATLIMACECPPRTTRMPPGVDTTDCDDAVSSTSPEGSDVCNGRDDDCDGTVDEMTCIGCWIDADRDGYALASAIEMRLPACGDGLTSTDPATSADCNDASAAQSPMGVERCIANGVDDDCDGVTDDLDGDDYYRDCDSDGYGVGAPVIACSQPGIPVAPSCPGGGGTHARVPGDCDDTRATVRPGVPVRPELCDGVDNDCNPATPDGSSATWWSDACDGADGDLCAEGVFSCVSGAMACTDPIAETDVEACGGGDEDCDGSVDEAAGAAAWCLPRLPHASSAMCASGACVATGCTAPWNDCTSGAGCETMCIWQGCAGGVCADPIRVAASGASTSLHCAVRRGGAVVCWGSTIGATPRAIPSVTNASDVHGNCILHSDGAVSTISVSAGAPAASLVGGLTGATQVSCGGQVSCAVRADRSVYCFNASAPELGLLGNGSFSGSSGVVSGLTDAVEVSVGQRHACARRAGGSVVCWGTDPWGQLGDGPTTHGTCTYGTATMDCSPTPVAVVGLADAVALSTGQAHTCALRAGGDVVCWGHGYELGDGIANHGTTCTGTVNAGGPYDCSEVPIRIALASPAVRLEGAPYRRGACVTRSSGAVWCWTGNDIPREITSLAGASDLAVWNDVVCGITTSGLRCGASTVPSP